MNSNQLWEAYTKQVSQTYSFRVIKRVLEVLFKITDYVKSNK